MRATVLVDNIATGGLQGEWGLSIFIEFEGRKILLDAGASGRFAENARALGIDLSTADFAVLSHAHYDHSRGMKYFFEENSRAKFFLREGSEENCYEIENGKERYLGLPRGILTDFKDRIEFVSGDYELFDKVYIIPHKTVGLSCVGERESMYRLIDGAFVPDDFSHEQSLVFDTQKGLVIFNCCSHGGADSIIREVSATFPDKKVYALVGGFHLFNKTEAEINALIDGIMSTDIQHIITGHCTGKEGWDIIKQRLGDKASQFRCGLVMEF